jgi:thioredoxin reductase (NADPH)
MHISTGGTTTINRYPGPTRSKPEQFVLSRVLLSIMRTSEEADEQFYRDTESIAFPALSDEQLATLESLGTRRKVNRGEIIYKAGQRDVPFHLVLSGELEVFESRDGEEQILGVPGPRDFVGDISMLTGTAVIATVRGKAGESEILQIPAARFRRALAEIPTVSETIVSALIMRRKRLQRDREFTGLRILAVRDSREGHQLDDFLDKNHYPHRVIDAASEPGQALVQRLNLSSRDLPALITPSGMPLRHPSLREVARVAGLLRPLPSDEDEIFFDLAIVGAGPAGLGAAVYAASEGLNTVVLESYAPGGQAGASSLIENFFGFPTGISGGDLTYRAQLQAFRFGAKFTTPSQALSLGYTPDVEHSHFLHVEGYNAILRAKAVIIATGADYRRLNAEGREQFEGSGLYYAATPLEAQLCSGSTAIVAGAGNSAGQAAMFVSEGAEKVLLIVRGASLTKSMSSYLSRRVETKENIEILYQTEIRRMTGHRKLESVELENTGTGARRTVETPAVFSMIGALPCTGWLPAEIERNDKGFILTGAKVAQSSAWQRMNRAPGPLETSRPGVFAAGDVRSDSVKRCAAAVGEGGMAVANVHRALAEYRTR